MAEWYEGWEFCQLLHRGSWARLRPGTTSVYTARFDRCRDGDNYDVHSLVNYSSNQSRVSTRTSSRWDWLRHWQTKTADLGRPFIVSWRDQLIFKSIVVCSIKLWFLQCDSDCPISLKWNCGNSVEQLTLTRKLSGILSHLLCHNDISRYHYLYCALCYTACHMLRPQCLN